METTRNRIEMLMARLGAEASMIDAERIDPLLSLVFPGIDPRDMPDEVFSWLRDGTGKPPVVCLVPPSATTILGMYVDMTDTGRAKLTESARAITRIERDRLAEIEQGIEPRTAW